MIQFKMVKPFVCELITMLFVIIVIAVVMFGYFVEIKIKANILTIAAILLLLIYLFSRLSRVINWGIKALLDFVFQSTKNDICTFERILPYQASTFSEKWVSSTEKSIDMYYLIEMNNGNGHYTFISPQYVHLLEGQSYRIVYSKFAHILLEYCDNDAKNI